MQHDTDYGPCACGAWHELGEHIKFSDANQMVTDAGTKAFACPPRCAYMELGRVPDGNTANTELHARSGHVESNDLLVGFLYDLMRDHLPAGTVEKLVREQKNPPAVFTNGYLARYAQDLAARLKK